MNHPIPKFNVKLHLCIINLFLYISFLFQIPNEFVLTIKKDKKLDSIKLSSEYRNDILTSILKYYKEFADKPKNSQVRIYYNL